MLPACFFLLLFCLSGFATGAQTLGGKAAYNFLKLPAAALQAAAGGVLVSYNAGEVGLAAANPALLRREVSRQAAAGFNSFIAAAKAYNLTAAYSYEKLATTFGAQVHYLDYGSLPATDAAGNMLGQFRPVDYAVQVSAARRYLERWSYGLSVKFIQSSYGQYRSSALAADVGLFYQDTARGFSAALVVKNMGGQLSTYAGEAEELPFDLQVGMTQRLAKAPFGFSLTAQQLQTFDILYNDTAFNRDNGFSSGTSTWSKLVSHLVLATHVYAGRNLEATVGYNFLRRRELSIGTDANGLTGFSAGLRLRFSQLQVLYSRSAYQRGIAANQIAITVHLDRLMGGGR